MDDARQVIRPVEFRVNRGTTVRVIFDDWDSALIQSLTTDGQPLNIRADEHDLWLYARAFSAVTGDAFADHALDRTRSQAARVASLADKLDRLHGDLGHTQRSLLLEQTLRERYERDLASRDGFNRMRVKAEQHRRAILVENPELVEVAL